MFDLHGKTALVTGAAGGIAQAMGIALAEAGADIIGVDIKQMDETKRQVEALDRKFLGIVQNLSELDRIPQIVAESMARMGHIDILINCAGISDSGFEPDRIPWEEYRAIMEINLNAMVKLSIEVYKQMVIQGTGGKIINITSILALMSTGGSLAYTTSKCGIVGMTMAFAAAGMNHGIWVNALAPGSIVTDMLKGVFGSKAEGDSTDYDSDGERIYRSDYMPTRRMGLPKDLKGIAIFLASPESDFLTGQVICVDGGIQNRNRFDAIHAFE